MKTLKQFVRQHRKDIDLWLKERYPNSHIPQLNDKDREEWVLNDESLYYWARQEGVKV